MNRLVKKLIRWTVIWVILPAVVFYGAAWLFHPERYLLDRIAVELETQTGIVLKYGGSRITLAGGIALNDIILEQVRDHTVSMNGESVELTPKRYFTGDHLVIRPAWTQFVDRNIGFAFSGRAYGGSYHGILAAPIQQEPAPFVLQGAWSDVDLARLDLDYPELLVEQGRCRGTADLHVDLTRVFRYRGPLDITIEDAHYRADSRFTGDVDMPEFNRATAAIELNYEEVRLHDIRCYGPENSLRITGMIYQRLPVRNTWLELELRLYMSGAPDMTSDEGYIPLKIKGPVKDPDILFLGRNLRNQSVMPRLDD